MDNKTLEQCLYERAKVEEESQIRRSKMDNKTLEQCLYERAKVEEESQINKRTYHPDDVPPIIIESLRKTLLDYGCVLEGSITIRSLETGRRFRYEESPDVVYRRR